MRREVSFLTEGRTEQGPQIVLPIRDRRRFQTAAIPEYVTRVAVQNGENF